MKKILTSVIFILSLLFLAACNKGEGTSSNMEGNSDEKLKIYTTIYPFQYFTERCKR